MDNLTRKLKGSLPSTIFDILIEAGELCDRNGFKLFMVGGRVRDLFLGRAGMDIDLVVEGNALVLAEELAKLRGASFTPHHRFKTAALETEGYNLDIATARRESYPHPGALPVIEPGSLDDDLKRRDFSINAMAVSLNNHDFGRLIDPLKGRLDLNHGLIRILHPGSFKDDATRIFRAVRYEQRFGFSMEAETMNALVRHKNYLASISPDRLRYEVECILNEKYPEKALKRAGSLSVLSHLHPSLQFSARKSSWFKQAREMFYPQRPPADLYLALACYGLRQSESSLLEKRLNLPGATSRILADAVALQQKIKELSDNCLESSEIYNRLINYDPVAVTACMIASDQPAAKKNMDCFLRILRYVKPALSGDDLKNLGVPHGPQIGQMLDRLKSARLDGHAVTRQDEANLVKNWLGKS